MSWYWLGHGVRLSAPDARASLESYAPAMSLSGHWPWDSVMSYWLLIFRDYWLYVIINIISWDSSVVGIIHICREYLCTLLSIGPWDSLLLEHVACNSCTVVSVIIRASTC